ncbi:hypothetical protein FN846DRAFT_1006701 [Sphaerosporella brunnea]|uniref:Uncharacterized protein n=1 Tax=Sphaerosporella brunnea TaxID=1250544 RepID=A0A5J5FBM5_9PEZI|nr:hypothetical protein FN846DRAFT_1006701 [Sphaerosporella brunnea]
MSAPSISYLALLVAILIHLARFITYVSLLKNAFDVIGISRRIDRLEPTPLPEKVDDEKLVNLCHDGELEALTRMQNDGVMTCYCKLGICAVCFFVLTGIEMIADVVDLEF